MCKFASFKFKPTGKVPVRVAGSLDSHHAIPGDDGTRPNGWREGHYLPTGQIDCRTLDVDRMTGDECRESILARWPLFVDFLRWATKETGQEKHWDGSLYLGGLTSAEGLTLPESVGGFLYLGGRFVTLAEARALVVKEKPEQTRTPVNG